MHSVAVLEDRDGQVTALTRDGLMAGERGDCVVITRGEGLDSFSGNYDLFVVAHRGLAHRSDSPEICCRALLVPGNIPGQTIAGIQSKWVVSYGLSGKDSITVSSLEKDTAVLALQRELMTLGGEVIERQELPVRLPAGSDSEEIMAACGSLLLLGVLPVLS